MVKIAHIFLAFLALLGANAHSAFSQSDYGDFQVIDSQIIWQHVYETELDSAEIVSKFDELSYKETGYTVNYKKYGKGAASVAPIVSGAHDFDVVIDVKDNRYRVTCSNMKVNAGISMSMYAGIRSESKYDPYEKFYMNKKGEMYKAKYLLKSLDLINLSLFDHFDIKNNQSIAADDW